MKQFIGRVVLILVFWTAGNGPLLWAKGKVGSGGDEQRAQELFYHGDYLQSAEEYFRLYQSNPRDPLSGLNLAAALESAGRSAEAASLLQRVEQAAAEEGEARVMAGDFNGARRVLMTDLLTVGAHDRAKLWLGLMAYMEGQYPEAIEFFWQVLAENPKQGAVHLMLARSFKALAGTAQSEEPYFRQRALEEYQLALNADPSLWMIQRDLALWNESRGEWVQALRHWRMLSTLIGDNPEIRQAMAQVKNKMPGMTATATATVVPTPAAQTEIVPDILVEPFAKETGVATIEYQALTLTALGPDIEVGLGRDLKRLSFGCNSGWRLMDGKRQQIWEGKAKSHYRIEGDGRGHWNLKNSKGKALKPIPKNVILEPLEPGNVMVVYHLLQTDGYAWSMGERRTAYYRGRLQLRLARRTFTLINQLPLEAYLLSVVPREMVATWPLAALQAQAIVARSDTLNRRKTHKRFGFDVCPTAHCAAYGGVLAECAATTEAVLTTRGAVLAKDSKLLPTFYSHSCGGATQGYQDAWGGKRSGSLRVTGILDTAGNSMPGQGLPLAPGRLTAWLAGRPPAFCNTPQYAALRNYRWVKIFTREELSLLLNSLYGIGTVDKIEVIERSASAYVRGLRIQGSSGDRDIRGDQVKAAFGGLRSTLFAIIPIPDPMNVGQGPQSWLVWGAGWGHGVGLCQVGAGEMARQGYSGEQILRHYFPEGEIAIWY